MHEMRIKRKLSIEALRAIELSIKRRRRTENVVLLTSIPDLGEDTKPFAKSAA